MTQYVTLAERYRRKMEHMRQAIAEVDGLLTVYARERGGRFLRYGSTAKGHARGHSDVDIIADFPGEASFEAANYAEQMLIDRALKPDVSPSGFISAKFIARVEEGAVILS